MNVPLCRLIREGVHQRLANQESIEPSQDPIEEIAISSVMQTLGFDPLCLIDAGLKLIVLDICHSAKGVFIQGLIASPIFTDGIDSGVLGKCFAILG